MKTLKGSCGCGKLEYTVEGEPLNSTFCYCKECQKLTGSDKFFGVEYPLDKFKIIKGNPTIHSRKGDSGKSLHNMFCSTCGVSIGAEVTVGNFYSIAVPTLFGEPNIRPSMCIYTMSAPKWAVFPSGVPKFNVLPPNLGD